MFGRLGKSCTNIPSFAESLDLVGYAGRSVGCTRCVTGCVGFAGKLFAWSFLLAQSTLSTKLFANIPPNHIPPSKLMELFVLACFGNPDFIYRLHSVTYLAAAGGGVIFCRYYSRYLFPLPCRFHIFGKPFNIEDASGCGKSFLKKQLNVNVGRTFLARYPAIAHVSLIKITLYPPYIVIEDHFIFFVSA